MTYVPSHFRTVNIDDIAALIKHEGFGTLIIGAVDRSLDVSHVPVEFILDGTIPQLLGHVAASNPQAALVREGCRGYALVNGPHGYISPRWYDHENVPTWDYANVHFQGEVSALTVSELKEHLARLIARYEGAPKANKTKFYASEEFVDKYIHYIVGFRLVCDKITPLFKLSQDKSQSNKDGILKGLSERMSAQDADLATLIREHGIRKPIGEESKS